MLPIVEPSLTNASTSSPDWKLPVIATVAEASAALSGSLTPNPASIAIAICSNAAVVPAVPFRTGELENTPRSNVLLVSLLVPAVGSLLYDSVIAMVEITWPEAVWVPLLSLSILSSGLVSGVVAMRSTCSGWPELKLLASTLTM